MSKVDMETAMRMLQSCNVERIDKDALFPCPDSKKSLTVLTQERVEVSTL